MGKQEMNDCRFVVVLTTGEYFDWFGNPETLNKRDMRKIRRFISDYNPLFDFTAFIR